METRYDSEVRPLLDLIDTLRDIGLQNEISLPQIAVMGDQSSGKSSVLENISRIPFPRGSGLVTKCPTELILSRSAPGSAWKCEVSINWKDLQPAIAGKVESMEELPKILAELSKNITDDKMRTFSTDSIVVRISSPSSPDLTLIDLPGIVRTATNGQDPAVIEQVNSLINKYIAMENTIILAVVPSNQDVATVDILERAYHVDPTGDRTIGVLTKPDLIGPGSESEALDIVLNKKKPLRLGYIMVKNASQLELNQGASADELHKREMSFFENHSVFAEHVHKKLFGVDNLVSSLTTLLVARIRQSLPHIVLDVKRLLAATTEELLQLGEGSPSDPKEQQAIVMQLITKYSEIVRKSCKGDFQDPDGIMGSKEQFRQHSLMHGSFRQLMENVMKTKPSPNNAEKVDLVNKIENKIASHRGRELPGFINSQVFAEYIIEQVEEWRPIIEECRSHVVENTVRAATSLCSEIIGKYPLLCHEIQKITTELMLESASAIEKKLEEMLEAEETPFTTQEVLLEVVNTIRFRTFDNALRQILDTTNIQSLGKDMNSIREDVERRLGSWYLSRHGVDAKGNAQEVTTLVQAYWDIASRRVIDNTCMYLDAEISTKVRENLCFGPIEC